ncbi:MAG: hypothetical protein EKK61_03280 [Rickettsiales bacterium]|nr:MAG: hypothetical protein EKK61_03280 [Rickettsiales bacterium]
MIDEILGEITQEHYEDMTYVADHLKAVMMKPGCGESSLSNHDSIKQLCDALPNLEYVGLPVSWFVNNTNIKSCYIKPGIEKKSNEIEDSWQVSNYNRKNAYQIYRSDPNDASTVRYGGTMPDSDVLSYATVLKDAGKKVAFYPILLVDNKNKDWRGLITGDAEDVQDFYAQYESFVMHYVILLKGIVETMIIGSELKGLTSIQDANKEFPFVDNLITLSSKVRKELGNEVQISYASNWDEYHSCNGGYRPLDKLWADKNIDFVGYNCYIPLTDTNTSNITKQDIKDGFTKGEGIDFYRNGKVAVPFDGEYNQWKNLRYWYSTDHWDWDGESSNKTPWVRESKKIVFTEFGFRSIDKCTNQPNVYGDELPRGSNGKVDYHLQMKAIRATLEHNKETGFINLEFCYAWDTRGYGWHLKYVDGKYWANGHWIDGKIKK